jgi:hypothetical protein
MKRVTIINNFAITALTAVALAFCLSSSMQAQKSLSKGQNSKLNTFPDCTVVDDNIVANCGFETADFAPEWAFAGPNPEFNFVAGGAAHSGNFGMAMGSIGDVGCISQTVNTVPDQSYTITYWIANSNAGAPPANEFQVYWNDGLLVDLTNLPDAAYAQFSIPGQVGTGADVLSICARNDPDFIRVDDIVVN